MLRLTRVLSALMVLALLLSACQPVMPTVSTARPHTAREDAPPYGVRGPYVVGVRDFVIEGKEGERPITVSVWYPALNPDGLPEAVTYTLGFPTNENPSFVIAGRALQNAAVDASAGPYPLMVFSHGAYTFRLQAAYLTEHLASYGFIVMAVDHEDNWGTLFVPTYPMEVSRPRDMTRMIDLAEQQTAGPGEFTGLIDVEHVAAAGHSMGGQIAMEIGGARLNLVEWQQTFCVAFPENTDCSDYRDHLGDIATRAGLATIPEDLWPDWSDPRVDAIVPLAPNANMFGGGGLDNVQVPVLFMVGSKDSATGPGIAYRQTYETLPGAAKTRVSFENGDHLLFMNNCTA